MSKIYAAVTAVMSEIGSISKDRRNDQQGYKFRGIDEVYATVHPLLIKHKIFTVPEVLEQTRSEHINANGKTLFYSVMKIKYTLFAEDGSSITAVVIGEGMDLGDKASNKAMSVAHKYMFLQVFSIPTEDAKDPEIDSHELAPRSNGHRGSNPVIDFARRPSEASLARAAKSMSDENNEMPEFPAPLRAGEPGAFVITFGKYNGKRLDTLDVYELNNYCQYLARDPNPSMKAAEAIKAIEAYLETRTPEAAKQRMGK